MKVLKMGKGQRCPTNDWATVLWKAYVETKDEHGKPKIINVHKK